MYNALYDNKNENGISGSDGSDGNEVNRNVNDGNGIDNIVCINNGTVADISKNRKYESTHASTSVVTDDGSSRRCVSAGAVVIAPGRLRAGVRGRRAAAVGTTVSAHTVADTIAIGAAAELGTVAGCVSV